MPESTRAGRNLTGLLPPGNVDTLGAVIGIDGRRRQPPPRRRGVLAQIDEVAVRVAEPQPSRQTACRRLDESEAQGFQMTLPLRQRPVVDAEGDVTDPLGGALAQQRLILVSAVTPHDEQIVAFEGVQPEGAVELLPRRQVGNLQPEME